MSAEANVEISRDVKSSEMQNQLDRIEGQQKKVSPDKEKSWKLTNKL